MHAVGLHFEGKVGSVVEDERHPVGAAHLAGEAGPFDDGSRFEILVPQLHHVDATGDAGVNELLEVRAVGRAEIEAAVVEVSHDR